MARPIYRNLILFLLGLTLSSLSVASPPTQIGLIRSDTTQTLFGYRIIPLGDQNSDGYDDILVWDYRRSVYIYYGGDPHDTIPALRIDSVQNRISRIGDLDGDLFEDVVIGGRNPDNWKLNVYLGGPGLDSIRDLWFGLDTLRGIGFSANGYDINSNGMLEIFSWESQQYSVLMFELGSIYDSIPDMRITPANIPYQGNWYSFGEGIMTGYFDEDIYPDLGVSLRYPTQRHINGSIYLYWGGPTFDTIPDLIISRPDTFAIDYEWFGTILENLGDVNGDGYDDFFAGRPPSSDSLGFLYFGGPNLDTIPDLIVYENSGKARWAGDLNGDGYNDLMTSIYGSLSGLGDVYAYLGGNPMDNIPDFELHNSSFPGYQIYFGQDCSGIGDFNGDGVNDFAFSAIDADSKGVVYIFSGWKESTDVNYQYEPILPVEFALYQNYPNPFNSETTVKFAIPTKSRITLRVNDILGRQVVTLLDKELVAGQYQIRWDGRDASGNVVSSGVYILSLEAGFERVSRKAILLK